MKKWISGQEIYLMLSDSAKVCKVFSVKDIGEWTVHYVAMRGLGMVDSFPSQDLGIVKALTENGKIPSQKEILQMAEKWRTYRSYAALCLWINRIKNKFEF